MEDHSLAKGLKVLKAAITGKSGYETEREIVEVSAFTFLLLLVLEGVLYLTLFRSIPNFISTYGHLTFLLAVGVVATLSATWHVKAYGTNFSCMSGMMIGMTVGMMAGFLLGALVGATNGMFVGAIYGMAVGIIAGAWCGQCCGIMGVMEGMMAGLMAGTMGAMLSVMMINDHLILFLYILTLICFAILLGLSYIILKERAEDEKPKPWGRGKFMVACVALTFITLLIMVYGPKGSFVWGT